MATTVITGNLGKTPELKFTHEGKPWTSLSVAWSERVKDRTGNWDWGPTVWVSVRVFGKQAENACQSLTKGVNVTCVGRLTPETWQSDRGEQTVLSMTADVVAPTFFFQTVTVGDGRSRPSAPSDPWNSAPSTGGVDDTNPPF